MAIQREGAVKTADKYIIDPLDGRVTLPRANQSSDILKPVDTDVCNAERLVKYYGDRLRYCYERKHWLVWNGKVWEWDAGAKIVAAAKSTVRKIYQEAGDEPELKLRKQIADHAKRSESDHRISAMINLARAEPGIPVRTTELDTDPWLFNCLNGTIDLRTGELLPHRKENLLTVLIPVEYLPEAQCPCWLNFLDKVTGDDAELAIYLQRAVGYSLTGDTRNQVIFLLYGLGNNGKSTFTMTIRKLMAGYAERLDAEDLMLKDRKIGGGPKEGIANLSNKRYVVGSELQDGKRLDVSLVKDMTGGETVKGRRLYEHEVEFMPTFKLWLYGNHKPVIADSTLSIWRRVKQIPFDVTIPDNEVDLNLLTKLEAELDGILAWAVQGCLDWQQYGLSEPEAVTTATARYRHEQDILGDFLEDCCILGTGITIPKSELRDAYQMWCQSNSVEPVTQKTFRARLIEKGITEGKSGAVRYWKGITLQSLVPEGQENVPKSNENGTRQTKFPENSLIKGKQKDFIEKRAPDVPNVPTEPCRNCGCTDWWVGPGGNQLCSRCHPRPRGS